MKQYTNKIEISSFGLKIQNITQFIKEAVFKSDITNGIINLTILNTTASLIIQENADPEVLEDIETFFKDLVPMNGNYRHSSEGRDDMPAHIKSALTNTNLTLSIINREIELGIWQGIYLFEHREIKKNRVILVHIIGS